MTVEAITPIALFTVSGIGPYGIGFSYFAGSLTVVAEQGGTRTTLAPADFSTTPAASDTTGSVYLSPAAAATHEGARLIIERITLAEQGWLGVQGERERGLETQLDRIIRGQQELRRGLNSAFRLDTPIAPGKSVPGRALIFTATGFAAGPTADEIANAQQNANDVAIDAAKVAASVLKAALYDGPKADTIAKAILVTGAMVAVGDDLRIIDINAVWRRAPDGATDWHTIGADGVTKWYVLSGTDGRDLRAYGVSGVGDETAILQRAVASTADGTKLIVNVSASHSERLLVPATTGGMVWRDGAVLTYTREQGATASDLQSAVVCIGADGAVFDNPQLRYTGTFNTGGSYTGLITGLMLLDCDSTTVKDGMVEGFNSYGIRFGVLTRDENNLCKNNRAINANGSRNRVGGLGFSYQDGFQIIGGLYEENGLLGDTGTGYGFAGGSASLNINVVADGVVTRRNFRKGHDIHDGGSYTIINCTSDEDRLFGFDAQSRDFDFISLTYRNNKVIVDPTFTSLLQKTYSAITVQINPLNTLGMGIGNPQIIVEGNTIEGIGNADPTFTIRPIGIVYGGKTSADITVAGNKVNGTIVEDCLLITTKAYATGTLNIKHNDNTYDLNFVKNLLKVLPESVAVTVEQDGNRYTIPTVNSWRYEFGTAKLIDGTNYLNGAMLESIIRDGAGSVRRNITSKSLSAGVATDMFIISRLKTAGFFEVAYSAGIDAGAAGGAVRGGKATFAAGFFVAAAGKRGASAVSQTDVDVALGTPAPVLTWTVVLTGTTFVVKVSADIACQISATLDAVQGFDSTVVVV